MNIEDVESKNYDDLTLEKLVDILNKGTEFVVVVESREVKYVIMSVYSFKFLPYKQSSNTHFDICRQAKSHGFIVRLTIFVTISRSHNFAPKSHDKVNSEISLLMTLNSTKLCKPF